MGNLMEIDCLMANVTAVGTPVGVESEVFVVIFDFFAISGRFCGRGATLWYGNLGLSPKTLAIQFRK